MKNAWQDDSYIQGVAQKLGLRSDKVFEYINLGILELDLRDGSVVMESAQKRIDRHLAERWVDKEAGRNNIAVYNLFNNPAVKGDKSNKGLAASQDETYLHAVKQMITNGANDFIILQTLMQKQGLSVSQSKSYLRRAKEAFKKSVSIDNEFEVNRAYERYNDLYARAIKDNNYPEARSIMRDFAVFFKINPPAPKETKKTQAEIENEGGIVRTLVYVPDNGRDPGYQTRVEDAEISD